MARVTKNNVGGTNYDIAHEGELKNSGFEVVNALPTTNLFVGRQVMYNGQLYVYNSERWVNVNAPYEAKLQWGGDNFSDGYSPIDAGIIPSLGANRSAYMPAECIDVEYSRDGGETWVEYILSDLEKSKLFSVGGLVTIGNYRQDNTMPTSLYQMRITLRAKTYLYSYLNKFYIKHSTNGSYGAKVSLSAAKLNSTEFKPIGSTMLNAFPGNAILNTPSILVGNRANYYDRLRFLFTIEGSEPTRGLQVYLIGCYGGVGWYTPSGLASRGTIYSLGAKQEATFPNSVISQETVNFDINNIEPTQTGNVSKTSTWLWQYLVQAVNWLKANNVRLSDYNTKVAELVQADSDNNASVQSVRTDLLATIEELSNGLATVATSGSYNDLTDTPTLAAVATSGDYNDLLNRPTFSGSYNDLTDKPTLFSGSYEDLTNKPNLATVATSGSYNDLTDKPTLFSGSYDDLTNKPNLATVATSGSYDDLLNTPALVFQNIGGTISSVQIPDGLIANAKLANPSMSLNGITVNLGDTSILPWYVDYNEVDYPARIREHWLQIYRNGVWANLMYLGDILPTQVGQITSLDDLSWYNEQVSEYEVDSNTTTSILNGTTSPAALLLSCTAEQLTLNLFPISGKTYGKGSLDSLITNLQGKEFSVFVENDLDTILASGNDYLVRIKISKVPTPKAIIECYIAR